MRLIPLGAALLVMAALFLWVFQRDTLYDAAGRSPETPEAPAPVAASEPVTTQGVAAEVAAAPNAPTVAEPQRVSVVVLDSEARAVDQAVLLRGRTEAAREVNARAETSGLVVSEPLRKGAFVDEGQLLCAIDPGTREATLAEAKARLAEARAGLPAASARVREAEARLAEAEINNNAAARLSEGGFASETRVANTKASVEAALAGIETARSGEESAYAAVQSAEASVALAEREIERLQITAPFSGLLETDTAELGTLLQPGTACATIIQLNPIKLVGFVPEAQVGQVTLGAQAGARLISGDDVAGTVSFISRSADPQTRTFRVEITVPNPDLAIRDGQTAEIAIASAGAEAHLVPASALTLDDAGTLGLRIVEQDPTLGPVAGFRPITLLRDSTQGVYVLGLPARAQVITVGQEYVTDGVPLRLSPATEPAVATQ